MENNYKIKLNDFYIYFKEKDILLTKNKIKDFFKIYLNESKFNYKKDIIFLIQLSDGLKPFSVFFIDLSKKIFYDFLKKEIFNNKIKQKKQINFILWAGTNFGDCDTINPIIKDNSIIFVLNIGHQKFYLNKKNLIIYERLNNYKEINKLKKNQKLKSKIFYFSLPVFYYFKESFIKDFSYQILDFIKKENKKNQELKEIILLTTIQFIDLRNKIADFLIKKKIKIKDLKLPNTQYKNTLLGCSLINKEANNIFIISEANFHLSQFNSVYILDPINKKIKKYKKKNKSNNLRELNIFLNRKNIGLITSTKQGQNYINILLKIKPKLEKFNKQVFIFISDNIYNLDDFNFIDLWVNASCPRITDDLKTLKPMINLRDLLKQIEIVYNNKK